MTEIITSNLPDAKITDEGLLLPAEMYRDLGEVEIIRTENYILIKPRNLTARFSGFIRSRISVGELHEDYETSLLASNAHETD